MRQVNGILLSPAEAELAAKLARIAVSRLELVYGTVPGEVLRLRDQLAAASARGSASAQVSIERGSAEAAATVVVAGSPREMTAQAAAAHLGSITARAVRSMCEAGVLIARKQDGRWQIEEWSVAALAARRKGA